MTITELLIDSFWHNLTTENTIQIRGVDLDANTVSYITIETIDDAYDDNREQTTINFDDLQTDWAISEHDESRIAEGKTNADLT